MTTPRHSFRSGPSPTIEPADRGSVRVPLGHRGLMDRMSPFNAIADWWIGHRPRVLRRRRGEATRGQALVELVVILPVLMLLLVAAADLARLFDARVTVAS